MLGKRNHVECAEKIKTSPRPIALGFRRPVSDELPASSHTQTSGLNSGPGRTAQEQADAGTSSNLVSTPSKAVTDTADSDRYISIPGLSPRRSRGSRRSAQEDEEARLWRLPIMADGKPHEGHQIKMIVHYECACECREATWLLFVAIDVFVILLCVCERQSCSRSLVSGLFGCPALCMVEGRTRISSRRWRAKTNGKPRYRSLEIEPLKPRRSLTRRND